MNNSYLINYQNPLSYEQDNNINSFQNQTFNNNAIPNINNLYPNRYSSNNILIYEDQNDNNHFNPNEEENIKLMRSRSGGFSDKKKNEIKNQKQNQNQNKSISNIYKNNNNSSQFININENISTNEKTFQTLEQTLKELEEKKIEIENKMFQEKNKINNSQYNTRNANLIFGRSSSPQKVINKEENDILQSDNIIMKEDIDRLNKINMSLENEISQSRDLISDLQTENEKLKEENFELKSKLNDYDNYNYTGLYMNGQISKENFLEKNFNEIFLLQNKLKELQNNYNLLQKEKTQYEVDFKVLLSKYDEIKDKYEKCNYELMNNKRINDNELYNIDNKINSLSKEVEKLRMENSELRQDNEKTRTSLNLMSSERDMYKEKFEDEKYKNEILNKKIFEVENGYNQVRKEKEYERFYQRQMEENHRNKSEAKNKIAQELQNKIQQYRRERLQKKSNEDFY
jgi:chromosome segregation ATPase